MSLHVMILAAGNSRRMQSGLPKALVEVGGKPMLAHLLETARALRPERLSVVVGSDSEPVREEFSDAQDVHWVEQANPLGTGHAVLCALSACSSGRALVLYVDGPLVSVSALAALLSIGGDIAVLAARARNATGFGRMVTDADGNLLKIVEEACADEEERRISEVNTGIMAGSGELLRELLESMPKPSGQKEQYLTDVVALARQRDLQVNCAMSSPEDAALGANTIEEVVELERIYQRRVAESAHGSGREACRSVETRCARVAEHRVRRLHRCRCASRGGG